MEKIFIYYSLTGTGDYVADYLSKNGYDIRKVKTKEPLPKNKFLSIIVGGYKAMRSYKDKLDSFNYDIKKYDEVIIGSPVWNDRLSSPINTVLDNINLTDKKVSFILYSGSGKCTKAKEQINKKCPNSKIIDIKTLEDIKKLI